LEWANEGKQIGNWYADLIRRHVAAAASSGKAKV
jgi:hypothetical protein